MTTQLQLINIIIIKTALFIQLYIINRLHKLILKNDTLMTATGKQFLDLILCVRKWIYLHR